MAGDLYKHQVAESSGGHLLDTRQGPGMLAAMFLTLCIVPVMLQGLKRHHQDHWLGVRQHNSEKFTLKMRRFRSRLNTLLKLAAAPPAVSEALRPVDA